MVESLTQELKGILLGDKGYLSKAKTEALAARGLRLLTPSRKNMKNKPIQTEEEKQLQLATVNLVHKLNKNKVDNLLDDLQKAAIQGDNLFDILMNRKTELEKAFKIMPIHSDLLDYWKKNEETEPIN